MRTFLLQPRRTNVNVTVIHNVYETRVNERTETRVSFNAGAAASTLVRTHAKNRRSERHIAPVRLRMSIDSGTVQSRAARFRDHGRPRWLPPKDRETSAAAEQCGQRGRSGQQSRPSREQTAATAPNNIVHPKDVPQHERPAASEHGTRSSTRNISSNNKTATEAGQEHQKLQQRQTRNISGNRTEGNERGQQNWTQHSCRRTVGAKRPTREDQQRSNASRTQQQKRPSY